jgi:hypothetical protein
VTRLAVASLLFLLCAVAAAQEENASNPLAKVKNSDLRWKYLDVGSAGHINDFYVDGLAGFGGHRQFDWGIGAGIRFNY